MDEKRLTRREFVALTGLAAIGAASGCDGSNRTRSDTASLGDVSGGDLTGPVADLDVVSPPEDASGADADLTPDDLSDASVDDVLSDIAGDQVTPSDVPTAGKELNAISIKTSIFPLGVQSGDVLVDGAVLWTRTTGSDPLALWLLREEGGGAALQASLPVTPQDGGYCHVAAEALTAATQYIYAFVALDSLGKPLYRSDIGRFRTPPAADALVPVRFGGTSCVSQLYKPYKSLSRAAESELDFFVLAGDTVYNDLSVSLSQYRTSWRNGLDAAGYRELFASTSIIATWDDHEVANNWDPETISADTLAVANQTFFEHLALRRDPNAPDRKWKQLRWGRAVELFVLDARSERKPSTRKSGSSTYLSEEQMAWLKTGLTNSDAIFKFIVNSVPITDMPSFFPSEDDRWEGYPDQREAILDHVAGISGVVWLSGDFHLGASARVEKTGPRNAMVEYFMGPSGQLPNPAWLLLNTQAQKDQFPFVTGTMNTTRFTVDPTATPPSCTVEVIDGDGKLLFSEVLTG